MPIEQERSPGERRIVKENTVQFTPKLSKIGIQPIYQEIDDGLTAENAGCVVRSLASAAGVEATDLDYGARLARLNGDIDETPSVQFQLPDYFSEDLRQGMLDSLATMDDLTFMDTPLGRKLRNVQIRVEAFNAEGIHKAIGKGEKVIFAGIRQHWAHIDKDSEGGLVFASDDGYRFDPESPDAHYPVLIFNFNPEGEK